MVDGIHDSAPSVMSIKKAMQTYARQGGTSSIFIGWVARPKHDDPEDGFKRHGRFKKASNMNYGLALSLRMEEYIYKLELECA